MFFILYFQVILLGKNETLNWNFGDKAAITFNTPDGEPIAVIGSGISTLEGCSSISDTNGNLLFYTDGVKVWNRANQIINPDTDLTGHYSATQSVMIVRKPGSYDIYYIFTVYAGKYIENINPNDYVNRGFRYSILDMRLNGGYGGIVSYNLLLNQQTTEKLNAVYHKNQKDVWIINHEWGSKNIITYLLTENGLTQKKISESTVAYNGDSDSYIGYIKMSPLGDKVAYAVQGFDFIELQQFDNELGVLSMPIRISTDNRTNNYGLEFSPDGKMLYVSEYQNNTIYQYNLSIFNADSINKTETLIEEDHDTHSIGALQLGPNGKIYVALNGLKFLGVINNPNLPGELCLYDRLGVNLGNENGVRSRLGLPNLNQSLYTFQLKIAYKETCQSEDLLLKAELNAEFDAIEYEWFGPNGFYSTDKDIFFENSYNYLNGTYYASATYRNYTSMDSVEVLIKNAPPVEIIGDTLICQNSLSKLIASVQDDSLKYFWSTGQRKSEITIYSPDTYTLQTIYPNGCSSFDTIVVNGLITNAGFRNPNIGKFGNLPIDRQHSIVVEFVNNGNDNLFINSVSLAKGTDVINIKNSEQLKGDLLPYHSRQFEIELFSKKPISINDSIVVEVVSPYCVIQFKAPIIGNIVVPVQTYVNDIITNPAKEIFIPIYSKINLDSKEKFSRSFNMQISLPASYFLVEACQNCEIVENILKNDIRYLTIEGQKTEISSNAKAVAALKGKVMVGTPDPGLISITKLDWYDSLFVNTFKSGLMSIESCSLAIRQIRLFKPTKLSVSPNPVCCGELNVEINSEESGDFRLFLVNMIGQSEELASWSRSDESPTTYKFSFRADYVSQEPYFLILKAPWSTISEIVYIVR